MKDNKTTLAKAIEEGIVNAIGRIMFLISVTLIIVFIFWGVFIYGLNNYQNSEVGQAQTTGQSIECNKPYITCDINRLNDTGKIIEIQFCGYEEARAYSELNNLQVRC